MKTAGYVAGMFVFGLAALAVVGWLMEARMGRPLDAVDVVGTAGRDEGGPGAAGADHPLVALAEGTAETLIAAAHALRAGDRAEATHALDAALRATDIGVHASGAEAAAFREAQEVVRNARGALQNGRSPLPSLLERAAADLRTFSPAAPAAVPDLSHYEGATVTNPRGVAVGELRRIQDDGTHAIVRRGGWQDFMGFIDLGGRDVAVPRRQLVFGPARTIGDTLVAEVPD